MSTQAEWRSLSAVRSLEGQCRCNVQPAGISADSSLAEHSFCQVVGMHTYRVLLAGVGVRSLVPGLAGTFQPSETAPYLQRQNCAKQ